MNISNRAPCPVCGQMIARYLDGRFYRHGQAVSYTWERPPCPGSGMKAEKDADERREQ